MMGFFVWTPSYIFTYILKKLLMKTFSIVTEDNTSQTNTTCFCIFWQLTQKCVIFNEHKYLYGEFNE